MCFFVIVDAIIMMICLVTIWKNLREYPDVEVNRTYMMVLTFMLFLFTIGHVLTTLKNHSKLLFLQLDSIFDMMVTITLCLVFRKINLSSIN